MEEKEDVGMVLRDTVLVASKGNQMSTGPRGKSQAGAICSGLCCLA
jgi:hypothetical protein